MTIELVGIGAAPGDNTGDGLRTGMGKVNNNFSNATHAASKLVGTAAGEIPLSEDVFLNDGNTNTTSANYQSGVTGGIGTIILALNNTGGGIADQQSIAGSLLRRVFFNNSNIMAVSSVVLTGTWRCVADEGMPDQFTTFFSRIA